MSIAAVRSGTACSVCSCKEHTQVSSQRMLSSAAAVSACSAKRRQSEGNSFISRQLHRNHIGAILDYALIVLYREYSIITVT